MPKLRRTSIARSALIGVFAALPLFAAQAQTSFSSSTDVTSAVRWTRIEHNYTARQIDRVINDNPPQGHSIGDTADSHGTLLDPSNATIGRFDVITRATNVWRDGERRMIVAEYSFGNGDDSYVIAGAGHFLAQVGRAEQHKHHFFPIVGGKGKFLGATGQCDVMRINADDTKVSCVLFVPRF